MPSLRVLNQNKAIRIRLTREFLEVSVNLELLPKDLSTLFFLERGLRNWLKFSTRMRTKRKKLLLIYWDDTKDSLDSKRLLFLKMRREAISLGWMVERLTFWEKPKVKDDT